MTCQIAVSACVQRRPPHRACAAFTRDANMCSQERPIRIAGSELGDKRHICAFFRSLEEEYRVLLPFIEEGFERGERAFHVVKPSLRGDHVRRLETAGIDVNKAEQDGQLKLCNWEEAYFPDGRFDQHRMLAMWQENLWGPKRGEFSRTRLIAHMEWSLEDREGVSDVLEYEVRFEQMHKGHPDPVICTYDLNQHSGALIIDVMRTHPMMLIDGILYQNPFFVPPELFLQQLRSRKGEETPLAR
jgi:MEDS: MEthanogen/methylotroph, DcmR Sensory domain